MARIGVPTGEVTRIEGSAGVRFIAIDLDELLLRAGAPITYRRPWLEAWLDCYPDHRTSLITVRMDDKLVGAALLAERRLRGRTEVVAAGHGPSDQVRLPIVDATVAPVLADAIAMYVRSQRRPVLVRLDQLPPGDPVAHELTARLRGVLKAGDPSPTVRFDRGRSPRAYTTRNHHQQIRRLANRLQRDGLHADISLVSDADNVERLLPELVRVCRLRDESVGRRSDMDRPETRTFFERIVRDLSKRGEIRLTTLHVDATLWAYALCFVDGDAHRMWNSRFDPAYARYGPGRLVLDAALRHALADPTVRELDWMRGEEAYKSSTSTHVAAADRFVAWYPPSLRHAEDVARVAWRHTRGGVRRIAAGIRR